MTHISKGNSKMGKIPNSSLRPVKDCINCAHCKRDCYALKAYRMYPAVRKAWNENAKEVRNNIDAYVKNHIDYCTRKKHAFFRFNVSGDIISHEHFSAMKKIASSCPSTRFLVFTKAFGFIDKKMPKNLTVVCSVFPSMELPDYVSSFPRAYAGDPSDYPQDNRAKKALQCFGNCETCGMCWNLKKLRKDVIFAKH